MGEEDDSQFMPARAPLPDGAPAAPFDQSNENGIVPSPVPCTYPAVPRGLIAAPFQRFLPMIDVRAEIPLPDALRASPARLSVERPQSRQSLVPSAVSDWVPGKPV